jgi:hypothetical protein
MAFSMIRHYIERLGYRFPAADTLVSCALRLLYLLHDFEVCSVPVSVKSPMPPPDQLTRLDKILVRMLPDNSPELEFYQQALTDIDARYQLSAALWTITLGLIGLLAFMLRFKSWNISMHIIYILHAMIHSLPAASKPVSVAFSTFCRVWDTADVKGEEGSSIEGATVSDYTHNQDE